MIALWLLAGHMVGDFILATRWQSAAKFKDGWARTRHVAGYCVPFVPIFFAYARPLEAAGGLVLLFALHWLTDCRRFRSTLGDVIAWRYVLSPEQRAEAHGRIVSVPPTTLPTPIYSRPPDDVERRLRLPWNPWEPIPLFIDQGLHVVQLAVVGTLFLT